VAKSAETVHLRFASSILARLGEELIPDADQGLLELARNAYDAGASKCVIKITSEDGSSSVTVTDDGDGMSAEDIRDGFLVLGRSRKSRRRVRGRLPVGEKGLGRLAALRLGESIRLTTRPRGAKVEHLLELDWSKFELADVVEDVPLAIESQPTRRRAGSEIRIDRLRKTLTSAQQHSLARSLLLLSDPFGISGDFEAVLETDEFKNLSEVVRTAFLAAADFRLLASVGPDGLASAELRGHDDRLLAQSNHEELAGDRSPYLCPAATLELYVFKLGGGSSGEVNLQLRAAGVQKVRAWLKEVGGVHLYHRGLRVRPFGDPGYDWLQLDVRRARSPEDRPSTNTVVGRVSVDDESDALLPKTDRLGFVENEAFDELTRFAIDATEFMAKWRTEDSRQRRIAQRKRAETSMDRARSDLASTVRRLPPAHRKSVERAVQSYERAATRRDDSRLQDVQLYRTLSTIGAATSVFAHESDKPTEHLQSLLRSAKRRAQRELGSRFADRLAEPFNELDRVATGLRALSRMPLRLLQADKRRSRAVSIGEAAVEVLETFDYFLDRAGVSAVCEFASGDRVMAAPAALEVITTNLVVNAIAAFYSDTRPRRSRTIRLTTSVDDSMVTLDVSDDGPGLVRISTEDVWKLGETRREGGSGLGLTIVRDTTEDLGGTVAALNPGSLGGATFVVRLPRTRSGV
jgi:signal transduction histidine kinase